MAVKEERFYKTMDYVRELGDFTDGFYPTVQQMKRTKMHLYPERFLVMILYLSSDPFKGKVFSPLEYEEYREVVQFAKELSSKIPLVN